MASTEQTMDQESTWIGHNKQFLADVKTFVFFWLEFHKKSFFVSLSCVHDSEQLEVGNERRDSGWLANTSKKITRNQQPKAVDDTYPSAW